MDTNLKNILIDILDQISFIEESLVGIAYGDYHTNRKLRILVVQSFEQILESSRKIPLEAQQQYPDFTWDYIPDITSKFIDPSSGLNDELVWRAAKIELKHFRKLINSVFFGR